LCLGRAKVFGFANDLIKHVEQSALLVRYEFGIADNVDKKHIGDLQLNFLLNLCGHGGGILLGCERRLYFILSAPEANFSKRGSFRIGSNMESRRSSAGVSGVSPPTALAYDTESSFCKAGMARSESPATAATRATISSGKCPYSASFSGVPAAIARSATAIAAALSPRLA